jgi:hypothetical protein
MTLKHARPVNAIGEGEGDGDGDGGNVEPKVNPEVKTEDIKFTDDQKTAIQKMINDQTAKYRKAGQDALTEVENLRKISNMSKTDQAEMQKRISQLTQTLRTTEEQAAEERRQSEEKHQTEIESLTTERNHWQHEYVNFRLNGELISAASLPGQKAINPDVVKTILRPNTELVEDLDSEGKPTGQLVASVKYAAKGEDGKPTVLQLSVADAVKKMSTDDQYLHLFEGKGAGGLGGGGSRGTGDVDINALLKDPVAYQKWRRENPDKHKQLLARSAE